MPFLRTGTVFALKHVTQGGIMLIQNILNKYAAFDTAAATTPPVAVDNPVVQPNDSIDLSAESRTAYEDMASGKAFSAEAYKLLKIRGLTDEDIAGFGRIIAEAGATDDKHAFLKSLSTEELDLVKRANSYGSKLTDRVIDSFSDEGAYNMLVSQDRNDFIDINNDGIVEHGAGKTLVFPPPNSPQNIKEAYAELTKDMSFSERLHLEGYFLLQTLCANIRHDDDGSIRVLNSDDPEYTNIFAGNDDATWKNIFNELHSYFDFLEYLGQPRPEDEAVISRFEELAFGQAKP
jgi:hypothetical protein